MYCVRHLESSVWVEVSIHTLLVDAQRQMTMFESANSWSSGDLKVSLKNQDGSFTDI